MPLTASLWASWCCRWVNSGLRSNLVTLPLLVHPSKQEILSQRSQRVLHTSSQAATSSIAVSALAQASVLVHPDKNRHPDATRAFQRVAAAWATLSNEEPTTSCPCSFQFMHATSREKSLNNSVNTAILVTWRKSCPVSSLQDKRRAYDRELLDGDQ